MIVQVELSPHFDGTYHGQNGLIRMVVLCCQTYDFEGKILVLYKSKPEKTLLQLISRWIGSRLSCVCGTEAIGKNQLYFFETRP